MIFTILSYGQLTFASEEMLAFSREKLASSGILKNEGGFVFVDVDDNYIHELIKFIEKEGFVKPPYFGDCLVGAHITVIYPEEMTEQPIEEIGQTIHFTLRECQVIRPHKMEGIEEVYFIVVEAPELDVLRQKYHLPRRQYDFHITVGVKPSTQASTSS